MVYTPGEQADPEFLKFYHGEWQTLLETVIVPGMEDGKPSWDRRAAYLLWCMGSHYDAESPHSWLNVLMGYVIPKAPAPPAEWNKPGALPPYVNGGVQFKFPF